MAAGVQLLVTYVAGPFADEQGNTVLRQWLEAGGRWLALHGSSGGKAMRRPDTTKREMVKMPYHDTLGGFFLSHPPIRKFPRRARGRAAPAHPRPAGVVRDGR